MRVHVHFRELQVGTKITKVHPLQTPALRGGERMGLRQLVRVHAGGGARLSHVARLPRTHHLLGGQIPRRVRVEGRSEEAVQPSSRSDGGRIHYLQRIL